MSGRGLTPPASVPSAVAVADPHAPGNYIRPNPDGSINIAGSIAASTTAVATAAAPTYTEGSTDALSMDLSGNIRVAATVNATAALKATAAAPLYVEASTDPLSGDLAGNLRCISSNFPALVDVNSGNKSASTLRMVLATDQPTLTNALKVDGSATTQPISGSVSITGSLPAFAAIPTVKIDQTTPGVTNAFDALNFPATVDVNAGAPGANTIRMALATGGAVTANAGTNLNTSALALETGGNLATLAGGVTASIYQNNIKQINGVVPLMGNGVTGTGSPRTTLANDNSALPAWGHGVSGATAPAGMTLQGTLAKTALPAAVTDGQMAAFMADKFGRGIIRCAPRELLVSATVTTTGTSGTLLAAQGANVFADIFGLEISNSSAAAVLVSISDGTKTYNYEVPANSIVGFSKSSGDARPASSVNTAWTYVVASGTTTIYINADFILNK